MKEQLGVWDWGGMPNFVPAIRKSNKNKDMSMDLESHKLARGEILIPQIAK